MTIIALILWLVILGVVCWLVTTYIPMAEPFPRLIIFAGVVIAILLIAHAFGLFDALSTPVPKIR